MDDLYKIIMGLCVTALTGAVTWLFRTVSGTKSKQDRDTVRLDFLERDMTELKKLPDRMTTLETTVRLSMSEIVRDIASIEQHLLRLQERSK